MKPGSPCLTWCHGHNPSTRVSNKDMSTDMTEDELADRVRAASGGDKEAARAVLEAIRDDVYELALRMLGHPADAEDAAQEILVIVLTHLKSFRGESAFRTWVWRVAAIISSGSAVAGARRSRSRSSANACAGGSVTSPRSAPTPRKPRSQPSFASAAPRPCPLPGSRAPHRARPGRHPPFAGRRLRRDPQDRAGRVPQAPVARTGSPARLSSRLVRRVRGFEPVPLRRTGRRRREWRPDRPRGSLSVERAKAPATGHAPARGRRGGRSPARRRGPSRALRLRRTGSPNRRPARAARLRATRILRP